MKYMLAAFMPLMFVVPAQARIERTAWGETFDHKKVDLYTLSNAHGLHASIATYGGTLVKLEVPDRNGKMDDIVRGFDTLDGYANPAKDSHYYGAIVGRFANVINGAQFTLDGTVYHLIANSGGSTLHGGPTGFSKQIWSATAHDAASPSLSLTYVSPDGDNNFPGQLTVTVTYTLTADDTLQIDYRAATDKPTVLNLTNHSYFNLKGHAGGSVSDHQIQIMADTTALRDGTIVPVKGTILDFNTAGPIGANIDVADAKLGKGRDGFNQNYIINGTPGTLRLGARVVEQTTGRVLEMLTTQPGMEFYSANVVTQVAGKNGAQYGAHEAFCLETQHYPNSPNVPSFPSTELRPGEQFHEVTVFRFRTAK